jgi:hypothetical protein
MRARLLCRLGELKGSEFDIGEEATIGRRESNTIVLGPGSVSSEHARIFRDASGHYVIEDLDSRNGTELDGRTLRGKEVLGRLHVVNFGRSCDFVFLTVPDAGPAGEKDRVSSTMVEVEPLSLPEALVADPEASAAPEGSASQTVVDREAPELPAALRDETDARTGRRDGD